MAAGQFQVAREGGGNTEQPRQGHRPLNRTGARSLARTAWPGEPGAAAITALLAVT
jgi:hypothetical protein